MPPEPPRIVVVDGNAYNCYSYVKSLIPELPMTKDLIPNSIYPNVDGVTILYYGELPHYVHNLYVSLDGVWIEESNFIAGQYTKRLLTWDYLKEHRAEYWHRPEQSG